MDNEFLSPEEQTRLLQSLLHLTGDSTIKWEQLAGYRNRKDAYVANIGPSGFSARLESIDGDGVPPYRLVLFNRPDEGESEELAAVEMSAADEGGDATTNQMLSRLYSEAVRRSRRLDESIRDLFIALDELEQGGHDKSM